MSRDILMPENCWQHYLMTSGEPLPREETWDTDDVPTNMIQSWDYININKHSYYVPWHTLRRVVRHHRPKEGLFTLDEAKALYREWHEEQVKKRMEKLK